jgi:ABC-type branched-subunit amino acid transport system permease subunit
MSSGRLRALASVFAPSAALLAVAFLGLLADTYWQYVLAISLSAAVVGAALIMLVGYARCITIATGAMLAIGAYGEVLPVTHRRPWGPLRVLCLQSPVFVSAVTILRWSHWFFRRW